MVCLPYVENIGFIDAYMLFYLPLRDPGTSFIVIDNYIMGYMHDCTRFWGNIYESLYTLIVLFKSYLTKKIHIKGTIIDKSGPYTYKT